MLLYILNKMLRYDIMKYSTHSLVAMGSIVLYDVFVDKRSLTESFTQSDAITIGLSTLATNLLFDVVSGLVPYLNENGAFGMVSRPLLTGLVYSYMYEWMMSSKYDGYRNNMEAFYIGSVGCLFVRYIEAPVISLLGFNVYN